MKKYLSWKWILFYIFIFLLIIAPAEDEQVVQNQSEEIQQSQTVITLKDYKGFTEDNRKDYLEKTLLNENLNIDDLKNYLNCMGDFAYQKDENLPFTEVLEWCKNEEENNKRNFLSHINELNTRESGNYQLSYDKEIEKIKEQKLLSATEQSIKEEESNLNLSKEKPTKYDRPIQVLESFGGLYEIKEISKNELLLYTPYYNQDEDVWIVEALKRVFIQSVYLSFIQTDIQTITVTVVPKESTTNKKLDKFLFKGSVKKEDALKIAQKLLNINKLDDLLGKSTGDIFSKDLPSEIFIRALYNDTGQPTLNGFFEELLTVVY